MNKSRFEKFIGKYNLNGTCNSVLLEVDASTAKVQAMSVDMNVYAEVSANFPSLADGEYAIYDTDRLKSLLSVLSDTLTVTPKVTNGINTGLEFADSRTEVTFALADASVIPTVMEPANMPPFILTVKMDDQFITSFVKARGIMKDDEAKIFTIASDGINATATIILGKTDRNTNRIKLTVNTTSVAKLDEVSFSSQYLRDILVANKDAPNAELQISAHGLAKMIFEADDITSTYYLIA